MRRPVEHYTPTKVSDGEHGSITINGSAKTLWGSTRVHDDQEMFVCNSAAPVLINDILIIDTAQYRVIGFRKPLATMSKSLMLERVDKPISP